MYKVKNKMKETKENEEVFPVGLLYADLATLIPTDMINSSNFKLRCIHREYVLGYVTENPVGDKFFTTVLEDKKRVFPYFDDVTHAEVCLEFIEDKKFVINANSITSFGIKEPASKAEIYNTLSCHSMNFRFLDKDEKLETKSHGKLFERR